MAKAKTVVNRIFYRFYEDCFMPSRLGYYERLLERLLAAGYVFVTVEHLAQRIQERQPLPTRFVVLRHDVDHDHSRARAMHELEARLGIAGSYYFRRCTINIDLMREIAAQGGEASYHYEEPALVAKRRALSDSAAVLRHVDEAQAMFCDYLSCLRAQTGLPMRVVASHGDFVNRRLNVANHVLLTPALREEMNILAEVYDQHLMSTITTRISDCQPPRYWRPTNPEDAIERRSPRIYLLIHPKHWRVNVRNNARAFATRLWEGASYAIRKRIA